MPNTPENENTQNSTPQNGTTENSPTPSQKKETFKALEDSFLASRVQVIIKLMTQKTDRPKK